MAALSTAQPYPGLRPFDLGDQDFFFGREAQTRSLRKKLAASRLIAVVGRSGCGKSSLVRAGLLPLLMTEWGRDGKPIWRVATFRPQGRPIAELAKALLQLKTEAGSGPSGPDTPEASALRRSRMDAMLRRSSLGLVEAAAEVASVASGDLLIVVDQFEEIFRFEGAQGSEADEATAFVRLLLSAVDAASPRVYVILTMRLDFLGDCARFQGLPEAISEGQFLVPNLNRAERRAAIEEPARKCGRTINPAVTQRLLNEIGDDPDQLPVLQHVLMRTWLQANGAPEILLTHYESTGGTQDAISRHASAVFDTLSPEEQRVAERVFKALSDLDRRARAIRRPQRLADLAAVAGTDEATVARIVNAFRAPENCFLMPPAAEPLSSDTLIDISHESLLRRWDKVIGDKDAGQDGWLVEEDKDGKTYRNLVGAAETFVADEAAVLPPALARRQREWWKKFRPNAAWADRYGDQFEAVERLLTASDRQARWERVKKVGMAIMVIVAVVGGIAYAGFERWRTQKREEAAEQRRIQEVQRERQIAETQAAVRQQEITGLKQEIAQLERELRQERGASSPPQRIRDDNLEQVVNVDAGQIRASSAIVNQEGYLWIGSMQRSNLQTLAGASVPPDQVRAGEEYKVAATTYLRQGLPDKETYVQQPSLGLVTQDMKIEARAPPVPYPRPSGSTQYWMGARVTVSTSLPVVYFQFATATRRQAQELSKLLKNMGYKVPGEERVEAAQGKREVRYFYQQDQRAAEKLAQDTNAALLAAGYSPGQTITVRSMIDFSGKKNAPGIVELWLDLPLRPASAG